MIHSQGCDFLAQSPFGYWFYPFGFDDGVPLYVVTFLAFPYLFVVLWVELDRGEGDDDLVGSVFDACS